MIFRNLLQQAVKALFNLKIFIDLPSRGNFQPFSMGSTVALAKRYGTRTKKIGRYAVDAWGGLGVAWR
ncbi:MAG: hypothetical protein ACRYFZ_07195 [Janthinobacterium lividum]